MRQAPCVVDGVGTWYDQGVSVGQGPPSIDRPRRVRKLLIVELVVRLRWHAYMLYASRLIVPEAASMLSTVFNLTACVPYGDTRADERATYRTLWLGDE